MFLEEVLRRSKPELSAEFTYPASSRSGNCMFYHDSMNFWFWLVGLKLATLSI